MSCHLRLSDSRESSTSIALFTFLGILSAALAIFTIFVNVLILYAFRKCRNFHAPTKALFCSLAFSDLGVGIVVFPLSALYCFAVVFNNINIFCSIFGPYTISAYCLGSVSFLTIAAIAIDRYYAFTLRLRYGQVVTFKRVVFLLAASWVFGLILSFSWLLSEKVPRIIVVVLILFCVVITSISYIKIAIGIRRRHRQIQEQWTIPVQQQHGGNQFRLGRYKKSLNTVVLIFCLLLACYLPYFIIATVTMVVGKNASTILAWNITSAFIYLNSLLNPLVYCWRMREIRREVAIALASFAR